jgi:hypothetical protein
MSNFRSTLGIFGDVNGQFMAITCDLMFYGRWRAPGDGLLAALCQGATAIDLFF